MEKQTILTATGTEINESAYNNCYGFTGRYLDEETGLWYFRARYFDNELGRFISRDPLGFVDGMSLYNGYFAERFALDPTGNKIDLNTDPDSFKNKINMGNTFKDKKWGDWQIVYMNLVLLQTVKAGVEVEITFHPNEKVCCNKIVFVQFVKFTSKLDPFDWKVDKLDTEKSPWYTMNDEGKTKGSGFGQIGAHGPGINSKDAILRDGPHATYDYWPFKMEFLSMAVCVEGKDIGIVYGAIQWGWKVELLERKFNKYNQDVLISKTFGMFLDKSIYVGE